MARRVATFDISMLGVPQLTAEFKALESKFQKKALRKGLRAGAKIIQRAAKANAPQGETGNLRKFIKVRADKRSRSRLGIRVMTGTRDQLGIDANDPVYYPGVVEYGSKNRPPQPFMRPAFNANQARAKRAIVKAIRSFVSTIRPARA